MSYALFIRRCRNCVDAIEPDQIAATCRHDGRKLVDHAQGGQCPRKFFQAAIEEAKLEQQGYGQGDARFPGTGGCGC